MLEGLCFSVLCCFDWGRGEGGFGFHWDAEIGFKLRVQQFRVEAVGII